MSSWPARALFCAVVLAMLLFCALRMRIVSDIASFMPTSSSSELASLSRGLTSSSLTRQLVVSIGAPDAALAARAAKALAEDLRDHPEVAWLRSGLGDAQLEELFALYFPRRHYFVSGDPERELPVRLSDEGLRESARRLRAELARPSAALVARVAEHDPLLAFPELLRGLTVRDDRLTLRDGVFVTRDGGHAILMLETVASPFDAERQRPLLAHLRASFDAIREELGAPLVLESTGVARFALDIEDSIRTEIRWLIAASTVGVVVLFLAFFRSLHALAVAMAPHALGVLLAATVGLAAFGHLNGLAIAFGVSLIGVSVDYSIHLMNHFALAPAGTTVAEVVRRLRPSLLLGGATTIVSLAGLAFGNFPGFYQMGVLASVGVAAALAAALFVIPDWIPKSAAPPLSRASARLLGARVGGLERNRAVFALVPIACVVAALVFAPRIHWIDDLAELQSVSDEVRGETERVRARLTASDPTRFLIAEGATPEAALAANDRLFGRLAGLVEAEALTGFRSLHRFLWSEPLQRANLDALRADASLPARLDAAFAAEGFRPGAFEGFADSLLDVPAPLRLADLEASPLGDVARAMWLDLGDRSAVLTHLEGVRDPEAITRAVADLPSVRFFDQKRFFRDVYGEYRERIVTVVLSGCGAVFAMLLLRYRRPRPALAAALPSLLVALLLAAIAGATGQHTHILHLIGLILVMGMGVDYGIFLVDTRLSEPGDEAVGVTLQSLLLSALTTIFVFGMLGFSEHPVLSALGRTTATGIALALLLAPASLLVLGRPRA